MSGNTSTSAPAHKAGDAQPGNERSCGEHGKGLVSVVIPCYNQAHYLREAVESALAQTHSPMEIIVVDDGSPDNTSAVAACYPSVRCVRQKNQGLAGARNTGLRESNGDFVMFLDADDRLNPNAAEAHLHCFAAHPEAGWVVGDIDQISDTGAYKDSPRWPFLTSCFYEELLRVNHIANTIAVMFRRSVLEKIGVFDRSLPAAEDYEMLLRAARVSPSAHHRNVVAYYRRYRESMSRKGALMLRAMHMVMGSQQPFIAGDRQLQRAWREGDAYWRDQFGAITCEEIITHVRRGRLMQAGKSLLGLLWYVRGRVLLLPWKFRRRVWQRIRERFSSLRASEELSQTVEGKMSAR